MRALNNISNRKVLEGVERGIPSTRAISWTEKSWVLTMRIMRGPYLLSIVKLVFFHGEI
jgi:hypothetical protein